MSANTQLIQAVADLDEELVKKLLTERLQVSADPLGLLADCREGMALVGKRYEAGEYYVSELMMAGEVFKQAMALIEKKFADGGGPKRGTVVIGTVQGDIHDIGKGIVVSLLQAANFNVIDLGVDIPAGKFIEAVKKSQATVLGLSGLLTVAFDGMKATVEALAAAGLRSKVRVMIGGGSVTEQVRAYVGADAVGADAQAAVYLCDGWLG